jgi:general secretion pathway protein G
MIERKQHRGVVRGGFTLMEVLVVVAIIVILAGVAVPIVMNRLEDAKVDKARLDCQHLSDALGAYNIANGEYPASLEQLVQPPEGGGKPYIAESQLTDPWNKHYQLRNPGTHRDNVQLGRPEVFTTTPSGQEVGNWPKNQ